MHLFYSPNSPFARKCRVMIIEKGLQDQVQQTKVDLQSPPAELLTANPLGKIPAFVTKEGLSLCDSPLICEYLDGLPSNAKPMFQTGTEKFPVLALAALADGLMDAAVDLIFQARRPAEKQWPDLIAKREQVILRTIDHIAHHALPGDEILNIGTLNLACALAYIHFRHPHLQWQHNTPALDAWLAHVLKRPSFEATQPEG